MTDFLRQLIILTLNNVLNRIYPFVTSLSSCHPARGSVHLPNFKYTQERFSKHTTVAVAYTPHGGIKLFDCIIICNVKPAIVRQNWPQHPVLVIIASLRTARQSAPLTLIPFNWSFPSPLTIFQRPVCINVLRNWFSVTKAGKARFNPFVDFIQHGSKVLL